MYICPVLHGTWVDPWRSFYPQQRLTSYQLMWYLIQSTNHEFMIHEDPKIQENRVHSKNKSKNKDLGRFTVVAVSKFHHSSLIFHLLLMVVTVC